MSTGEEARQRRSEARRRRTEAAAERARDGTPAPPGRSAPQRPAGSDSAPGRDTQDGRGGRVLAAAAAVLTGAAAAVGLTRKLVRRRSDTKRSVEERETAGAPAKATRGDRDDLPGALREAAYDLALTLTDAARRAGRKAPR